MNLKYHSVVLFVREIGKSKHFYTDVLQQEVEYDFGKNISFQSGISLWEIQEGHVIANAGVHGDTSSMKPYELYFETGDMEEVQRLVADHRLPLLHDLLEEPWGQRTLRFYDPDNNLIEVGETLETFIRRYYDSGMSPQEVSEKTTVPVGVIRQILNI
jgi:catechol 2,3-dioxygenase-like lactoylglutathione lyase family enzyme